MANTLEKNSLVSDSLTLISLLGEYHAPLQSLGYSSPRGIILCNTSPCEADSYVTSLLQLPDMVKIPSINRNNFSIPNNSLGLHLIRKYEPSENIANFLIQDSFQPLAICGGFAPEELTDFADTIALPLANLDKSSASFTELAACKKFFQESPKNLHTALNQAISSEIIHLISTTKGSHPILIDRLAIIIEIFLFWYRTTHDEKNTQDRKSSLYDNFLTLMQRHINCPSTVDIGDAFTEIFYEFLDHHNDISYCPVNQVEGIAAERLKTGNTILWDSTYYLLPESLCRKICSPLLREYGWLTICRNLVREGIVEPDSNQQSNYTRKKVIPHLPCDKNRFRFLYFPKDALHTLNHLTPEERMEEYHE